MKVTPPPPRDTPPTKATPPSPSQTLLPTGDQALKHIGLGLEVGDFLIQNTTQHGSKERKRRREELRERGVRRRGERKRRKAGRKEERREGEKER